MIGQLVTSGDVRLVVAGWTEHSRWWRRIIVLLVFVGSKGRFVRARAHGTAP